MSQVAMFLLLPFLVQWSLGGFAESSAVALWAFVVVAFFALNIFGPAVAFALLEHFVRSRDRRTGFWPRSRSGQKPCF